jgi:hypothetical protein
LLLSGIIPLAMGRMPVGTLAWIEPFTRLSRVESFVFELGVTIFLPSKLIQWAWGWAGRSKSNWVGIRRCTWAAYGASSMTASSPFSVTCTSSVSTRVMTWAGDSPIAMS